MTTSGPSGAGVLVVVPTYNERENLERVVGRLFASVPDAHLAPGETGLFVEVASANYGNGTGASSLREEMYILQIARQGSSPGRIAWGSGSGARQSSASVPAATQGLEPALRGGAVYTDDKAPVEWLTDLSILRYATGSR